MKNNKTKSSAFKTIAIFITVMVVCYFGGVLTGRLIKTVTPEALDIRSMLSAIYPSLCYVIPAVSVLILVLTAAVCCAFLKQAKSGFKSRDGEDETKINTIEKKLSDCVLISNVSYILDMLVFSVWVDIVVTVKEKSTPFKVGSVVVMAVFVIGLFVFAFIQRAVVEQEKEMNPEKSGEILSINFTKDWEKSMDEAEMLISYKAAYKSFKVVSNACLVLWILALIGNLTMKIGVMPAVFVSVIWLLSVVSYSLEANRLERL